MSRPLSGHGARVRTFRRDRVAWGVALAAIAAGAVLTHHLLHRRALPPPDPARCVSPAPRISALCYDRISSTPAGRRVDAAALREQLLALRREGYEAITLRELYDFYFAGGRLPVRSLLLTFDGGHLETYRQVDPILRELGWRAVVLLSTGRLEARDPSILYWDRLERMEESGIWEIGTLGHLEDGAGAGARAGAGTGAGTGTVEDLTRSRAIIEGHLPGVKCLAGRSAASTSPAAAISIPAAGISMAAPAAPAARDGAPPPLLFREGRFGLNTAATPPDRLERLQVEAGWTVEDLRSRLGSPFEPVAASRGAPAGPIERGAPLPRGWTAGRGASVRPASGERSGWTIAGAPKAELWTSGGLEAPDWILEADLRWGDGEVWLVEESTGAGGEWRCGASGAGLFLKLHRPGEKDRILESFPIDPAPGSWHRLRAEKRGQGLWVEWDGGALAPRPLPLPEKGRGPVGLVAWRKEGEARLEIAGLRFTRQEAAIRSVSARPERAEVRELLRGARGIAALSPPAFRLADGELAEVETDRDLFAVLCRRNGWELVPALIAAPAPSTLPAAPSGESGLGETRWVEELLRRLRRDGASGVRLDLSALPGPSRGALAPAAARIRREMARRGCRFESVPEDLAVLGR